MSSNDRRGRKFSKEVSSGNGKSKRKDVSSFRWQKDNPGKSERREFIKSSSYEENSDRRYEPKGGFKSTRNSIRPSKNKNTRNSNNAKDVWSNDKYMMKQS